MDENTPTPAHTRSVSSFVTIDANSVVVDIDLLDYDEVKHTRVLKAGPNEYPFVMADVLLIARDWLDSGVAPEEWYVDGA